MSKTNDAQLELIQLPKNSDRPVLRRMSREMTMMLCNNLLAEVDRAVQREEDRARAAHDARAREHRREEDARAEHLARLYEAAERAQGSAAENTSRSSAA